MYKAIIFDLGGVLFTNGTKKFIEDLHNKYNLDYEKLLNVLDRGIGTDYREGRISRDEFWQKAAIELDLGEDINELEEKWIRDYELIEGTRDIVLALAKKLKVYYLSDNVRERVHGINNNYNFLEWFEDGIFSHEVGVRKPDPKIYQYVLEKIGVAAEELIFIDDKEINLPPARELGMTALLFETPEKLRNDLKELGVLDS